MKTTPAKPSVDDALQVLAAMTSEELLARLGELHTEEQVVRAALRVVRARERAERVVGRPADRGGCDD